MTARRSSGSIRAESAVELTSRRNITEIYRRSALSCGAADAALARPRSLFLAASEFSYREQ